MEEQNTGEVMGLQRKEIPGMFNGPILKLLVKLSFPIFFGMVFQILYNIVDTIWISRIDLNDPSYVGGVGIVFPIIFLIIAFASGLMVGTSSLVARSIGEQNRYALDRTAESGLFIGIVLAALLLAFGYIFDKKLLRLLGAEGDYFVHGLEYLRFMLPAGALMVISHVFAGILMGEGLMKPIMFAMMIATLTNIILDPIFIFPLGMGVQGAALATAIAQIVPFIYVIYLFRKKKTIVPVALKPKNVNGSIIRQIVAVGFPQSAGQITMAVSFLFFNRLVISIDPLALTAFSICGRFDYIMIVPIMAIGATLLTMIGQNFGRGNYERMLEILKTGLFAMIVVTIGLATVLIVFAPKIYPFFSNVDGVVDYAVRQTRIVEYSFMLAGVALIAQSSFQAIGRALPGLGITIIRLIGVAVPVAYFYVRVMDLGIYGVWLGVITGNVVAAAVGSIWVLQRYRSFISGKRVPKPGGFRVQEGAAAD
jgi:putative MATE family efflux protein